MTLLLESVPVVDSLRAVSCHPATLHTYFEACAHAFMISGNALNDRTYTFPDPVSKRATAGILTTPGGTVHVIRELGGLLILTAV